MPGHLVVIGGGYIGLELGSVWRRLGARGHGGGVPRPHRARRWMPRWPRRFERILTRQGMKFRLGMKVTGARKGNDGVTLTHRAGKGRRARKS